MIHWAVWFGTEKNGGENRQARGRTEYLPVRTHVEEDGVIRRADKSDQEAAEHSGKQAAAHGSNKGEQRAFGKHLPDEARARSAQCEAHRHFPFAPAGAREHQIGGIGAGDQ